MGSGNGKNFCFLLCSFATNGRILSISVIGEYQYDFVSSAGPLIDRRSSQGHSTPPGCIPQAKWSAIVGRQRRLAGGPEYSPAPVKKPKKSTSCPRFDLSTGSRLEWERMNSSLEEGRKGNGKVTRGRMIGTRTARRPEQNIVKCSPRHFYLLSLGRWECIIATLAKNTAPPGIIGCWKLCPPRENLSGFNLTAARRRRFLNFPPCHAGKPGPSAHVR